MDEAEHDALIVSLLTQHQPAIRFFVASQLPGDPVAADVFQLTNTAIWKKRGDFAPGTNFRAWAFSIARWEIRAYRQRVARDSAKLVFSDEVLDRLADEAPEHGESIDSRSAALQRCLDQLKPSDRELIDHRYFERTPLKVYAEQIGRSAAGLKVTLHRIRKSLGTCIERQLQHQA